MEIIHISIYNKALDEMGVKQEEVYVPFYFNPEALIGYWIAEADNPDEEPEVVVYIGAHKFICEYSEELIIKLNLILKGR